MTFATSGARVEGRGGRGLGVIILFADPAQKTHMATCTQRQACISLRQYRLQSVPGNEQT